ncbi:MAG: HsdR family type I site-specific deoxyribonuclease [Kiritimatiellae bacterium]|nr:HsdR family type I site-specific deoxyribonuclease [Kiritimatiellia bacterium]
MKNDKVESEVVSPGACAGVAPERAVQDRIIELLRTKLGYEYLGNLSERENSCLDRQALKEFLVGRQQLEPAYADRAIAELAKRMACPSQADLYSVNKEVYLTLRYPMPVATEPGKPMKQVYFIDWQHPLENNFSIAEEVTVRRQIAANGHRRPDVVIWVNGIALCVIELKKANVSVAEGIRQNYRNQQAGEIPAFFAAAQLLMAGNESEGLKYATTLTPEKYWLKWKEPCGGGGDFAARGEELGRTRPSAGQNPARGEVCDKAALFEKWGVKAFLDKAMLQMLDKERLLAFIHDGVVFDGGVKKVMRPAQFFALEAAKPRIMRKESGIIWHSQGSGKSLTMVWLAQWIKEHRPDARVVIITDRDELDKQITNGFKEAGEKPYRATSGADLIATLNGSRERLISTLIHKFGANGPKEKLDARERRLRGERSAAVYLKELADKLPPGFKAKGDIFVFVDECHRTQGGVMNLAMKKIMGPDVMLIGFTGTPLLKSEKGALTSYANFGPFIHTYKFDEAVEDGVVLDLRYEARDIEQNLAEDVTFDSIFERKTKNLLPAKKEELKKRWARMQNLFSAKERVQRIVTDICMDMGIKPALREGWGNAMLVCESVYQAYRFWAMFSDVLSPLKDKCAVVTSYGGDEPGLSEAFTGEQLTEAEYKHRMNLAMRGDKTPEDFEEWAKKEFVEHPAKMKLLIVVDKLLTGFDAPPATYLYIDKKMEDHNLFQAICRVNRLNGEKKRYGYIIDYKHLFESIRGAVEDYTNGAFKNFEKEDVEGLLKGRLEEGRKALEAALERCDILSEPVLPPKSLDAYCDYFVARDGDLQQREDFYQACIAAVRAWSDIAQETDEAGYSPAEASALKEKVRNYDMLREAIMKRAGDFVDLKLYDAEMRSLLDNFVTAKHALKLADLEDLSFLDLIKIDKDNGGSVDPDVESEVGGERGVAETLAANVRRYIFRKKETNPAEYRKFSERINRLLEDYRKEKIEYGKLLAEIAKMGKELKGDSAVADPRLDTEAKRSLCDNLGGNADLALKVFEAVGASAKPGFRRNAIRRRKVEMAIEDALQGTDFNPLAVYQIVEHQSEFDADSYMSDEPWM